MILSRKALPLLTVAASLLRFAAVSALGLPVLHLVLQAGDVLARQLLGDAANNFALFMVDALRTPIDSTAASTRRRCAAWSASHMIIVHSLRCRSRHMNT